MKKLLLFTILISYGTFSQNCIDPIITDFECSGPSHGVYPGNLTTVLNPDSSGINMSANVGEYIDDGGQAWDALILDYGTLIDLTTNNILRVKLYTPTSIQILAKIEGGTNQHEIWSPFSTDIGPVNTWIEFEWDFSAFANNSTGGDANTKLVLIINGGQSGGTPSDIYHIDDIKWASATLSVGNETLNNVKIYPNPTQEKINISSIETINEFKLIDVTGKEVMQKELEGLKSFSIDISSLNQGLYFLNVKSGSSQETIKILKQ